MKFKRSSKVAALVNYLGFLNVILPKEKRLSPKERIVLAHFICLDDKRYKYNRFSADSKRKVVKDLEKVGIKLSGNGITNYVTKFREKEFVISDEDDIYIIKPKITELIDEAMSPGRLEFKVILEWDI